MSQTYVDPKTGERHEFPDDVTPEEIDAATRPAAQSAPSTSGKVPFFGDTVKIDPSAQPGEWRMRSLPGGGEPGRVEEFVRAGLTLPANLLAGGKVGRAGFKDAAANERVTQILNRTGRYPDAPRPQVAQSGRLGSVGTRGPGGLVLDLAEFLPVVGRILKAARMGQKVLPTGAGKPVDMSAPAMGGGPVPPGLTSAPIVPQGQVGPAFQPATVGVAQPIPPRPDSVRSAPAWQGAGPVPGPADPRVSTAGQAPFAPRPGSPERPPPAWQQPRAVTITGDTGPTGASAGAAGRGTQPAPAQKPSGSQDLPMTREHRPAGTGHPGTPRDWPVRPPADPPPGPMTMPGPSRLEGVMAKDSILRQVLEIAEQWRNQRHKGF